MSRLEIFCFGPLRINLAGRDIFAQFEADTARALLLYLNLNPGIPLTREMLAALLWPDQPVGTGLHNLRQALFRVRRTLGDIEADNPFLEVTRNSIRIIPTKDIYLDVNEFGQIIQSVRSHVHRRVGACLACIRQYEQAAALYAGEFLQGFFLASSELEDWITIQRENFRAQALEIFYTLAEFYERKEDYEAQAFYAQRQIEAEVWREEAYRQLMRALYARGQRGAALTQYKICARNLAATFGAKPSYETEKLYNHILFGRKIPDIHTSHNLPAQSTPLFGREKEIQRLTVWLSSYRIRLITLVGLGGMGKTRLALAIAQALIGLFENGIWWIPLADLEDLDSAQSDHPLAMIIAARLHIQTANQSDVEHRVLDFLAPKEALLVFDNLELFESEARGFLNKLLETAPKISILATSRQRINMRAEQVFRVDGLSFPARTGKEDAQWKDSQAADQILSFPSIQLFLECARRQQPDFVLEGENLRDAAAICQAVFGMPLAIELAAAHLGVLSIKEILHVFDQNIDQIQDVLADIPPRQRSLRLILDHAWGILNWEEQLALAKFCVFEAGCSLEAAQEVAGLRPDILKSLLEHSLLQLRDTDRVWMHQMVRSYVTGKLHTFQHSDGRMETIQYTTEKNHSQYYLRWVTQLMHQSMISAASSIERIELEFKNIRKAWLWAVENRDVQNLASSLEEFFVAIEGAVWQDEGKSLFLLAADRLRQWLELLIQEEEQDLQLVDTVRITLSRLLARAGALRPACWTAEQTAEPMLLESCKILDQAIRDGNEALRMDCALALHARGQNAYLRGDFRLAEEFSLSSLAQARACRHPVRMIDALNLAASAVEAQGDYRKTRRYLEECAGFLDQIDDPARKARTLHNLGELMLKLNQPGLAENYFSKGLEIARNARILLWEVHCLGGLAQTAEAGGKLDRAEQFYLEANKVNEELNDRTLLLLLSCSLARLYAAKGEDVLAWDLFRQALQVGGEGESPSKILFALREIASFLAKQGRVEKALELLFFASLHPSIEASDLEKAQEHLTALASNQEPSVIKNAQERAQSFTLEEAVLSLLI